MNPEGERMVDERREEEMSAVQSKIRAGIYTEPPVPSRVVIYEVRGEEVVAIDPVTGEDL